MPLPSLFTKGNINATKWSISQKELDKHVPLEYIINWFKDKLSFNPESAGDRVMVLKSSTGSGKSTVLPPEIYHQFFENDRRNICVTQPRVMNAITIPVGIIPYHSKDTLKSIGKSSRTPLVLGENIGYQTGNFSKRPRRGIIYMQVNILGRQLEILSDEEIMQKYNWIIIDEVHERSSGTDFALVALKQFIERNYNNPKCPFVVVTSATFDTMQFADLLLNSVPKPARYKNIIDIEGNTYPIQEHFLKYDSPDFIKSVRDTIITIHTDGLEDFDKDSFTPDEKKMKPADKGAAQKHRQQFRDILVFVYGSAPIKKIAGEVDKLNNTHEYFIKYPAMPIPLTGDVVGAKNEDYKNLFRDINSLKTPLASGKLVTPVRRVMIATDVAETGVTIDTLKYVIETGFRFSAEFNPIVGSDALILKPVTQGAYKQRRGRVGRQHPGICYAMYTKETFESMDIDQYPDIVKSELTNDLLRFLIRAIDDEGIVNKTPLLDLFTVRDSKSEYDRRRLELEKRDFWEYINRKKIDLSKLELINPPSADAMHYALNKLYVLGAIDASSVPTRLGFCMSGFLLPLESVKMVYAGYAWDSPIIDLITIASMLDVRINNLYPRKLSKSWESNKHNLLKNELLIADDFIKNMIAFYMFIKAVKKLSSSTMGDLRNVENWCGKHGLDYKTLLQANSTREELIKSFAAKGFNPYQNNEKSIEYIMKSSIYDTDDIYNYVKNIKHCIYEGYKINIAQLRHGRYYSVNYNIPIAVKHPVAGIAKYILYDSAMMFRDPSGMYSATTDNISVLDGFVPVDLDFMSR